MSHKRGSSIVDDFEDSSSDSLSPNWRQQIELEKEKRRQNVFGSIQDGLNQDLDEESSFESADKNDTGYYKKQIFGLHASLNDSAPSRGNDDIPIDSVGDEERHEVHSSIDIGSYIQNSRPLRTF